MDRYELEQIIMRILKPYKATNYFQVSDIVRALEQELPSLTYRDNSLAIDEVINSLLLREVLITGTTFKEGIQAPLPWLRVTKHGKKVLESDDFVPYDPDGYMDALKKKVTDLDEVVIKYMEESIQSFYKNLLISTTLTLGAASERLIILLSESFVKAHVDAGERLRLESRFDQGGIFKLQKVLLEEINKRKSSLPKELFHELDLYLGQLFQFIRLNRNEKGHPDNISTSRDSVFACLVMFINYIAKVYELIRYFLTNPIS